MRIIQRINPNLRRFTAIPKRVPLTQDLFYFLGLWKGDGITGHHIGIVSRDIELLGATKSALIDIFLQDRSDIHIQIYAGWGVSKETIADFKVKLEELGEVKEKVAKAYGENGLAARLFVNNMPLRRYVLEPLTSPEFLNRYISRFPNFIFPYFAGLFDAEGWIDFKKEVVRAGWKDKPQAELVFAHLSKFNFEIEKKTRSDGIINLTIRDLEKFHRYILPFVKCKRKIDDFLMLKKGEFKETELHAAVIKHLLNRASTVAEISKSFDCSKTRIHTILRQLLKMGKVQRKRRDAKRKNPSSILKPFEYSLNTASSRDGY